MKFSVACMAPPGGDIKSMFHRSLNFLLYHMQKKFRISLSKKKLQKFWGDLKNYHFLSKYLNHLRRLNLKYRTLLWVGSKFDTWRLLKKVDIKRCHGFAILHRTAIINSEQIPDHGVSNIFYVFNQNSLKFNQFSNNKNYRKNRNFYLKVIFS